MRRYYSNNPYFSQQYIPLQNEQRFIGPVLPFIGGALIGYIAGRPQYNYQYPIYYPMYYPYYTNNYYN